MQKVENRLTPQNLGFRDSPLILSPSSYLQSCCDCDSFGLTDAAVIVVRYFGGTKLGVSGLIQAYKRSAAAALEAAPKKVRVLEDFFRIEFGYDRMGDVMAALDRMGIAMRESHFGRQAWVEIAVRQKDAPATLEALRARLYDVKIVPAALAARGSAP